MSTLTDLRTLLDHLESASLLIDSVEPNITAPQYEMEATALENLIGRFTALLGEKEAALAVAAGLPPVRHPIEVPSMESQRCQAIYNYLISYKLHHDGNPPTIRQIADACDIPSTSMIRRYLSIIQQEGFINVSPKAARSIEITGAAWLPPSFS